MSDKEFVQWFKGFVAASHHYSITPKQWDIVKDKLEESKSKVEVYDYIPTDGWVSTNTWESDLIHTLRDKIIEHYEGSDDILFADGFDECIIGFDPNLWRVVYSRNQCIQKMVKEGMDEEEAVEHLEFNTFGAYLGKGTPIWVEDFKWKL